MLLAALLAPAAARAQKPFFEIRRAAEPSLQATRPLTGPAPAADRVARALDFARGHAGALGLTPARVAALGAPQRSTVSGIERLTWQRSFGGIPAFGDELRVAVAPDGAVLSASGGSAAAPPSLTPSLTAAQAMAVVSDDAGAARSPLATSGPHGARRTTTFAGGGRAQLVVYGSRLAWRVTYGIYDTVVDATTGAILRRASRVKFAAPADVWDDHPNGTPPQHVDLETFGPLRAGATLGNDWMRVFTDEDASDSLDAGEEVPPPGAAAYAFTPFGACGATTPCSWDPTPAHPDWQTNRRQVAIQAFYLANRFRQWLAAPPIGFDGFGNTVPPLDIETDWGADFAGDAENHDDKFDNSAMVIPTPIDAGTWAMQLSLFGAVYSDGSEGFRAVDAGDDASIVDHEYTHGYTNQTVVDGGSEALDTHQAWAIDEASADFFAKSYLVDKGFETDTATPGDVDMGDYTDAASHRIRTQGLDCPVGVTGPGCPRGGYTYASFGHVINRPEPHADGEIWAETMWDLRRALAPGRATALAAQALAIVPPQPSFLDMRNAILTAAGSDEAATIWQVFARRGMGCDATTNGSDDVAPHAGFNVPPCPAPAATPTPTTTPAPTPTPTPRPAPTVSPTATPVATPPARPTFTLRPSGRRAVKFTVTCRAACSVVGTLSVSRATAKRLHLGSRRTVGMLHAKLTAAGRRTFTVRLSAAAARALKRVKSFRATLTVRAAGASRHRTVTIRR